MESVRSRAAEGEPARNVKADRLVLRLAFAATFGFSIAGLLDWEFSFLTPMLAVQILVAMPASPGFREGIAIPLIILIATSFALAVSTLFAATPAVLLAVTGLVICWSFYGQRRGAPAIAMLLTQIAFCCVPVASTISIVLAHQLASALIWSSVAAIVTVWLAHLLFPAPAIAAVQSAGSPKKPSGLEPVHAARVAISDTIILLPLLIAFIIGGDIDNIVILIISLSLLREIDPGRSGHVAGGILLGNILGGALGVLAYQFVVLADGFFFFILTVLVISLWFGNRLARGGATAPIYALAFGTFLLILGLGITPLPGGSGELFAVRIFKILLASGYVIGGLSLVTHLRRDQSAATT
jgi:hypothetical protein